MHPKMRSRMNYCRETLGKMLIYGAVRRIFSIGMHKFIDVQPLGGLDEEICFFDGVVCSCCDLIFCELSRRKIPCGRGRNVRHRLQWQYHGILRVLRLSGNR